jgi:probable rRNA maturation factor
MGIDIDIIVNEPSWKQEANIDVNAIIVHVREHLTLIKDTNFSILLTNDNEIQTFNENFRHKDMPTNVLSFPCEDIEGYVGDIVLSYETVLRESKEQDKAFSDHATHMIIHGYLHLLGYDHIEDAEAELMEAHEAAILSSLNIKNPYDE